jgi:hypothetical protein
VRFQFAREAESGRFGNAVSPAHGSGLGPVPERSRRIEGDAVQSRFNGPFRQPVVGVLPQAVLVCVTLLAAFGAAILRENHSLIFQESFRGPHKVSRVITPGPRW